MDVQHNTGSTNALLVECTIIWLNKKHLCTNVGLCQKIYSGALHCIMRTSVARDVFKKHIIGVLIKHVHPDVVVHRARRWFYKKKKTVIFTIFSVVELKSTSATFSYLKHPSIDAFF
jgi:hypothetical protein